MKSTSLKAMKFTSTLFLGFLLLLFVSCSPSKETQLIKTWKLANMKTEILFKFEEESAFLLQSENLDGTISQKNGTWKFAEGKETLLIDLEGDEQAFKVSALTDTKLILLPEGEEKMKMEFSVKK